MPKVPVEKGKRSKLDASAPKRNLSAYFLCCAAERDRVNASNPNLSLGEAAKELGRRWAAADPNTKHEFEKLAAKDKDRYEKERDKILARVRTTAPSVCVEKDASPLGGIERSRSPGNPFTPVTRRHADLLLQRVNTLYENETASDCKLISRDGKEFLSHRTILAAWSPVFANMFATDMKKKASGVCRLENFDGNVVSALLSFLYTGVLPDIDQNMEDMLDMADQYEVPDLRLACEEQLAANTTSKNASRYLYLADLRGLEVLKAKAAKFVAEHVSDF